VTAFNHVMSNYHGDEAVRAAGRTANDDLAGYVRARFAELRATPDDSVLGAMVAAHNGLTERELIDAARVIIFGGVETTSALITNALWALLTHPEQLAVVREDESLLPNAIEEALRWEAPVQTCTRHVTRDVEIGGITLRKGDTLQCMLGAANRDPAHYDAPDVFDVRRENARSSVVCEWEALLHRGGAGAVGGGGRVGDAVRTVTGVAGGRSSGGPSAGDGLPCAGAVAGGVGNITMKAKSKGEKVRAWPYIRNTLIGLAILATLCGLPAAYFAISEFMADGVSALYLPAQDCSPVGGFTANGVVQDEAGNPIANAPVRVWQTGDWRPMRATTFTDNTGAFEVTLTGSWSCYKVGIEVRTRGYREWQTIYFVPDPSWDWPDELPATVVVTLER
ncbi:MAG: cytochrome P450, partial [Chloroflexota bacterium]